MEIFGTITAVAVKLAGYAGVIAVAGAAVALVVYLILNAKDKLAGNKATKKG